MKEEESLVQFFKSAVESLLSDNILFLANSKSLAEKELARIEQQLEETTAKRKILLAERAYLKSIHLPNLRNNTFLTLWSALEEILCLAHKTVFKNIILEQRSSIERFRPLFQASENIDLSEYRPWNFLNSAQMVRNCLLHSNGRLDLMGNKEKLLKYIKANESYFEGSKYRINVTDNYVLELNKHSKQVLDDLTKSPK